MALTDEQRDLLLAPCKCGHTINDHGGYVACYRCDDEGDDECDTPFEELLVDRIARMVAEAEQRGRTEVSAAVEAVADEIESERTNFDFIRREHAQVAAQLRATLADPAAAVARIKAEALREALVGVTTHNGTPVTPKNLRWAATHEALCRSYIFDVLTGLADALARADEIGTP